MSRTGDSRIKARWGRAGTTAALIPYTPLERAVADIRAEARKQREDFANEPTRTLEWAAQQIDTALRDTGNEVLSLEDAAERSGYSAGHLSRMVREGRIPDLRVPGSKGRIFIRACDLPQKPAKAHIGITDEHGLASRLLGGKEA